MNLVRLNKDGFVTDVNCNKADIEAPDHVECGWQMVSEGIWVDPREDAKRISAIKDKAAEIIGKRYPITAQLNMLARYSELCGRLIILPLTAESAEKAKLEEAYDWIKAVRAESNRLEQDASATPNWPE